MQLCCRDGATVCVGTDDGWVMFYNLHTLERTACHRQGAPVSAVICSSSGKHFVTCSDTLKVWDVVTGTFSDSAPSCQDIQTHFIINDHSESV